MLAAYAIMQLLIKRGVSVMSENQVGNIAAAVVAAGLIIGILMINWLE